MRAGQKAKLRADKRDPRKTRIIKKPYAVDSLKRKKQKLRKQKVNVEATKNAAELEQKWQKKEIDIKKKTKRAVDALLQVLEKTKKKKNPSLFEDNKSKLKLNITCVKLYPSRKMIRFTLPHPFMTPENKPSICLLVADIKKGIQVDHEPTIDHFKQALKQQGIRYIREVISLRQLKVDYKTYEAKKHLSDRHDVFLADNKIVRFLPLFLGKNFYGRKRIPLQVELRGNSWDGCFRRVLSKSHLHIDNNGTLSSVTVGNSSQTSEEITDNVVASVRQLYREYPGGWRNIRNIYLKSDQTNLSIPVHVSFIDTNQVKRDMPKREKVKPVVGETGITANKVAVYPEGKVKVRPPKKTKDVTLPPVDELSDDEFESEESSDEESLDSDEEEVSAQPPLYEDEEDLSPVIEEMYRQFKKAVAKDDDVSSEDRATQEVKPQKRRKQKSHLKHKKSRGFIVADKAR